MVDEITTKLRLPFFEGELFNLIINGLFIHEKRGFHFYIGFWSHVERKYIGLIAFFCWSA